MNFFKTFLAAFLAIFAVFFAVILIFGLGIAGMVGSANSSEKVHIKDKSVLQLKMGGELVENAASEDFDFGKFIPGGSAASKVGLYQTIQAIRAAKDDEKIQGIYLSLDPTMTGGWASLKAIRDELVEFKKAKKFIFSYSEVYSEKMYYLASTADKIYMPASGMIEFNGLAASPMFYTGMFEKLELEPKVFRVGKFKSGVEPYLLKQMSEENKLQVHEFLDDIWESFADAIATSRQISREEVDNIATNFVFGQGDAAKKVKLVDELATEQSVWDAIREKTGLEKDEKMRFVSLKNYMTTVSEKNEDAKNKVAIIFADGEIRSGKGGDGVVGSETIVEEFRKAREDKNVKAIVLRVNSPGGSALASDIMTEEIKLTKKEKPIVVSMGDLAASGGYYISSHADYIFAEKNTITGSIGIYGILFNTQKMFNNKLGLTFDNVETHANADFLNPNLPSDKFHDSLMQRYITLGYGDFLNVVKTGRKFADSLEVDKIAQGRVWSGKDAIGIKLIDGFGNLDSAIFKAAKLANLADNDYRLELMPKKKNQIEEIFEKTTDAAFTRWAKQQPMYEEIQALEAVKKHFPQSGTYMLMPYSLEIQ